MSDETLFFLLVLPFFVFALRPSTNKKDPITTTDTNWDSEPRDFRVTNGKGMIISVNRKSWESGKTTVSGVQGLEYSPPEEWKPYNGKNSNIMGPGT